MPFTRKTVFALLFGVGGVAFLLSLGVWQTQRLFWKLDLIAGMEAQLAEPPEPITGDETDAADNFHPASAVGRFAEGGDRALFLTSIKPFGPGHRVIEPFTLAGGKRILVDRGYAPDGAEIAPPPPGEVRVVGALHWPLETSSFTPPPNLESGLWFARDVPALAEALGTEPVMLALSEPEPVPGLDEESYRARWPKPTPLKVDLPNNHLGYAFTWYSLAVVWLVMTVLLVRRSA